MAALRAQDTSYNEIANGLNADEVPNQTDGTWRSQTVNLVAASKAYDDLGVPPSDRTNDSRPVSYRMWAGLVDWYNDDKHMPAGS